MILHISCIPLLLTMATASIQAWEAGSRRAISANDEVSLRIGSDFDFLMLTRIYATAVCRADDDSVPDSCEIPDGSPDWSIHGLWPNYKNGTYPQFCDGVPRKFDSKLIESIEQRLLKMWPNLYPTKPAQSLWKHEWEKHGTCAESLRNLSSELLYFNVTMELDNRYPVEMALRKAHIFPRAEPYELKALKEALKDELTSGARVQINCLTDKKTRQTLLGDVRICVDKTFKPIDCPISMSKQPLTYILGESPPLPKFKECPSSVTYLSDPSSRVMNLAGVDHREVAFWINPLISVYAAYFKNREARNEYILGVIIPFVAIVMLIYIKAGRAF